MTRGMKKLAENARGRSKWKREQEEKAILGFLTLYSQLAAAARTKGYALAVHGSIVRDLDLLAVPWVDEAQHPEDLLDAIIACCKKWDRAGLCDKAKVTQKPHGRQAWVIHLGGGPYIDLSVMPRKAKT